jgi:hypothetical protein
LPPERFEITIVLLTLSLAKPGQNTEAILETYGLFIYGDIQYTTNSFCKNVPKIATP